MLVHIFWNNDYLIVYLFNIHICCCFSVSAFFFECPEKQLSINAHIWTKSKFMGMSVGVNLVGDISLVLGKMKESYSLAMPSAYARSILTEPWVELGGRVNISSPESGCQAVIVFHTKVKSERYFYIIYLVLQSINVFPLR